MKECYKPKTSDEIQKASEEYIWRTHIDNASVQDHFIAGAKWMRERMTEKVAKWLRKNIDEDVSIPCGNVIKIISVDEFVEYFIKSMEEQK